MHWFLRTTKIPMGFPTVSTFRKRQNSQQQTSTPSASHGMIFRLQDLGLQPVAQSLLPAKPRRASWFIHPPKKARQGGSTLTPKQTKASIKLAMFGWLDKNLGYTKNVTFQQMRDSHLQALKIWKILGLPQVESLERHTEIGQSILYHPFQQKHVRQNGNSSPLQKKKVKTRHIRNTMIYT